MTALSWADHFDDETRNRRPEGSGYPCEQDREQHERHDLESRQPVGLGMMSMRLVAKPASANVKLKNSARLSNACRR